MEQQFDVILTNSRKLLLVFVGGLLVLVVASISVLSAAGGHRSDVVKGAFVLAFLAGIGGVVWLAKKLSTEPTRITVGAEKISVLHRKSGREQHVHYDNISAHRYQGFNGAEQLRVTLRDGRPVRLATNPRFHGGQDLLSPARALDAARRLHQQRKQTGGAQ